jgi:tetratricopeptide (TPR) repeat protein
LRDLKDYVSAIEAWKNALKYGMSKRIGMTRIGDSYLSLDNLEQAEASYKEALSLGYDKYAHLGMLKIHTSRNDKDKAYEVLSLLVKKEPGDPRIASEYKKFGRKYSLGPEKSPSSNRQQ